MDYDYDINEMNVTEEDIENELDEIFDNAKAETFEEKRQALIDYGAIEEDDVFKDEEDMLDTAKEYIAQDDCFLQKLWDAGYKERQEQRREERLYGWSSPYDYHEDW